MEDEKRLQDKLIKRFIIVLIVVGMADYVIIYLSDRLVMPYVGRIFFPEYEITESFSSLAISSYMVTALIGGILGLIPVMARLPVNAALNNILTGRVNSFFISGGREAVENMGWGDRILLIAVIAVVLMIIAIPYIAGAVYFSVTTLKDFRKIGAKRMQARKDYEKRRNLMISDIAHDLRTPITTIAGYAQALTDGMIKEEDKQTYLEAIRNKSAGMNDLIQLLFDYTRLDSEGFKLNREEADVCELVRECAAALYTDAEGAGMDMEVEIPDDKIMLSVDKIQFGRVVNNLIVNAIRHNEKGNSIGVFVIRETDRVHIAIADKGAVIPDDMAGHLYEPFYMGDKSRSSRGGSGLGLSVARKIIDMHGWKLELKQGERVEKYRGLKGYAKAFIITVK